MARDFSEAPPAFRDALTSLGRAQTRADVALAEAPAPSRIAPFAVAVNGEVTAPDTEGSGRFVVLHDPDGNDAWEGEFRIVALVKAVVTPEAGNDEIWADVAWSWLEDALADVPHRARGGTVTKVLNRSYGELAERPDDVHVELRVSWTPLDPNMEPHVQAWTELLAACAGVPPLPEGVTMLPGSTE